MGGGILSMASQSPERREPTDLPPGTVINGKFRIVSLLAMGGMGRIFRAEQAPLGRVVALKVLRVPHSASETMVDEFRKRFFREASILSRLQHVNVVTLFDYGRIEGAPTEQYFMAMEFLAGETLSQRLKKGLVLSVQDTLRTMRQIARGLREAHKLGAVHRDLKPSNVMLVPEEDGGEAVKILDFGIGKFVGEGGQDEQDLTQEGAFLGSPKYIAPEQVNERRVDARTDVYALGVIGYECLSGHVPFLGETNLETILAHCNNPVPPLAERTPGLVIPDIVEALVRRCLEKDPLRRPQSMDEVLRGITECERVLFGVNSLGRTPSYDGGPPSNPTPIQPGASSSAGWPAVTSQAQPQTRQSVGTASPLTRSDSMRAAPGAGRTAIVLGVVVGVLLAAGVAAVLFLRMESTATQQTATTPQASAGPAASAAATAPSRSFTLVLDSRPSGADVWDGDQVIGTTPMQVTIDRAAARSAPRRFVLRIDGYAPYTVLQGDSEGIVHVTAPLEGLPPANPPSATALPPPVQWRRPPPRATGAATTTQHPPQETDIKLQR
jgi:serine/threonine-protein kinase